MWYKIYDFIYFDFIFDLWLVSIPRYVQFKYNTSAWFGTNLMVNIFLIIIF